MLFMYRVNQGTFDILSFNYLIMYVLAYVVFSSLLFFRSIEPTNTFAIQAACALIIRSCESNVNVHFDKTDNVINVKIFFSNCGALKILQTLSQVSDSTVRASALSAINAILAPLT
jgi:hypothetical protein